MANNNDIYYSYANYQNSIILDKSERVSKSKNYINDYNSYGNLIKNYNITVNNPQFKENNFFLKSNNKSSKLIGTKKITKLKNYYTNLIINPKENNVEISTIYKKNNKRLNNLTKTNKIINNYSNIYINNVQCNQPKIIKNINQLVTPKLRYYNSQKVFNNNSYISIHAYNDKNNNKENNKRFVNNIKTNQQLKINKQICNKNIINKINKHPYFKININENNNNINYNNITEYNNYNRYKKIDYNNYNHKNNNNAINFNENINYNNLKNILNNTENSTSRKIINYNTERQNNYLKTNNESNKSTKTKIKIKIYPNYYKQINKTGKDKKFISKINLTKNLCLKCQEEKVKNLQTYNQKESVINNYAFYEIKHTKSQKSFDNCNCNKNYINNKTEQSLFLNSNINNKKEKINSEQILSLVRKNYELFLKKNKRLNLKKIYKDNIIKKKRPKSKSQIENEKNLDRKKALSYREHIPYRTTNSMKKNKNKLTKKNIAGTLSQKKYKEDYKSIIDKDSMNNIKTILFENQKENRNENNNVIKYNNLNLKRQIGCQFRILDKNEKYNNECINEVITYFNSENLKNRKTLN